MTDEQPWRVKRSRSPSPERRRGHSRDRKRHWRRSERTEGRTSSERDARYGSSRDHKSGSDSDDRAVDKDSRGRYRSRSNRGYSRWRKRDYYDEEEEYPDRYSPDEGAYRDNEPSDRHTRETRKSRYESQLERGLEDDDCTSDSTASSEYERRRGYRGSRRRNEYDRRQLEPSSTLHIRGIPKDKDEADIHQIIGGWQGVVSMRVVRDKITGQPRGFAFVEFESVEAAQVVMGYEPKSYIDLEDGQELVLEFSHSQVPSTTDGISNLDWICSMCQAVNFSRRLECHQCSTSRPANPQRVEPDAEAPSSTLRISNLEPQTTEDDISKLVSPYAKLQDVRLIVDRNRGVFKGFGFLQFFSIADASKVLHMLQNATLEVQSKRVHLAFARERSVAKVDAASNALEAAQSMSAYSAWAPKEFDEAAVTTAAEAPVSKDAPQDSSAYQYDSASGYYYHAASGFYYDANSGLFFDSSDQKWKAHDAESGQYVAVDTPQAGANISTAAQAAIAATNGALTASSQVPEVEYKPPPEARKRGAVIGSAAKINPESIAAAAKEAANAKAALERKMAIIEGRSRAKQKQKQRPKPPGKQPSMEPPISGHPPVAVAETAVSAPAAAPVQGVIRSSGKWGPNRNRS